LIIKMYELGEVVRNFFCNFILNESFFGWSVQERKREK